ncbi:MAG: 2Fe-2S iron-sulfur cluster binding domain-containing protein [Chloroflexi bacterium]|nr:2Fe-2S iron-sulfur cluster binding domain-containing protein [Chloroflexota bacterium]
MWNRYISAVHIDEVLDALANYQHEARVVAGGTDIILEIERGARKDVQTLIDISRVPGLDQIDLDEDGVIHIGANVTHNECVASKLIRENAFPLAQACWEVGSPQIRNRGTIAGNLVTASPANDTITPLMALNASVVLKSNKGERTVALKDFYLGVRKTVLQPDEIVYEIQIPSLKKNEKGYFIKLALRKAQAISLVNVAVVAGFDQGRVTHAAVSLGAVAPTIIRVKQAEDFLVGKTLDLETIEEAARLAMEAAKPISDVRSTAAYRKAMSRVITRRALSAIADGKFLSAIPEQPVFLKASDPASTLPERVEYPGGVIQTRVNGKDYTLQTGFEKTLLRLLREDIGLTGTKEGCAEGECGACTVILDGKAVMSCMVPAARAHMAEIRTVEGLADDAGLHPVQEAFVEAGAVQCGYCTPGFLMSAAVLLEELPHPSRDQIKQAFTGNLCRCTGYYSIIDAVERTINRKTEGG